MSLYAVCPLCRRCFYRKTLIKVADTHIIVFDSEQEFLKNECPLNPQSPTKKHTGVEFVGKKLPD
jgi:hypothetical protein